MANLFTEIGSKIEEFLISNRITQTDMAERIGVSKQVVFKIIHGKKAINLIEIKKIADVMGVSVDSLMQSVSAEKRSEPIFLMMGRTNDPNTSDDFRFINHVMDEMIALDELLTK
jgi:transcriptional regulator with XRE-family HTH domain